jgi:Fe-S-cluster containining protein
MANCKDCSGKCFDDEVPNFLKNADDLMKKEKFLESFKITTDLLEHNPNKCPVFIINIIDNKARSIKHYGVEEHWEILSMTIMKLFNEMESNCLGWAGAQEVINIIKKYHPESEEMLRKHLHSIK